MTGAINGFLSPLGGAVINSFWQMALLWVIYRVVLFLSPSARPAARTMLASLLLMAGFAWFVITFFTLSGNTESSVAAPAVLITGTSPAYPSESLLSTLLPVASVLYLALLIIPVLRYIRNFRYVRIIRRYGTRKIDVDWRIFVRKTSALMGIRKKVTIWVSEYVSSPVTIGYLKPVILVPLAAINNLSTQQMEAVLLHELSHIRRADYFFNLIISAIQTLMYFNPFVKALVNSVEKEREKSCDEMVLQFQYDSYDYASALLLLEKSSHTRPELLAMASGGKRADLLNRVESIMGVEKKPVLSTKTMAGMLAALIGIFGLNALLFLASPSTAEADHTGSYAATTSPFSNLPAAGYYSTGDITPGSINNMQASLADNTIPKSREKAPERINTEAMEADALAAHEDMISRKAASEAAINSSLLAVQLNTGLVQAGLETKNLPELKKYQEEQVKQALEASKKLLENTQWKAFEKNIADVFTEDEKARLKENYYAQVNKFDWKKWEDQLRNAYTQVDWDKVNYQLTNAVNQIRIDSLQQVYNSVLVKLKEVKNEMAENGLKGIPDSDVTLREIEQQKREAERSLRKLNGIRNKKVVSL